MQAAHPLQFYITLSVCLLSFIPSLYLPILPSPPLKQVWERKWLHDCGQRVDFLLYGLSVCVCSVHNSPECPDSVRVPALCGIGDSVQNQKGVLHVQEGKKSILVQKHVLIQ